MPVIRIYGVPPDAKESRLEQLIDDIVENLSSVPELGITSKQVTVFMPADLVVRGLGEEQVVYIDLFKNDKRTPEVKEKMASIVGTLVVECFPNSSFVEVLPKGYNPKEEGYWSWRKG